MAAFEMYPTIITPFNEDASIDWQSMDKLISLFAKIGCEGVFAVCQSSEMFFLSEEEKLELADFCIRRCHELSMKCVVSGHTQEGARAQIKYIRELEKLKPDAIILVSNRFAEKEEDGEVATANLMALLKEIAPDTLLGMYECPYPYKRLLDDDMLHAMLEDGRFRFIKDTCCEIETICGRLKKLEKSDIALFNANMATLYESMDAGARGYSGVMLNIMPEFFELLHSSINNGERYRAARILEYLSAASTIEWQNYPANAKFLLKNKGILKTTLTRNGKPPLTESQRKELIAFEKTNSYMYFSLLKHAPFELVCAYDSFFNECHASSVLPLKGGRVLVAYFAGAHENADDVGIWLSVKDGGAWQAPRLIAKVNDTAHWNPVLYATDEGIRIVFKVGRFIPEWESYTMLSTDEGESWSEPQRYPEANIAGGPVRNKPLRLASGEYLAPNSDETKDSWLPRIDFSKDGKIFERCAKIPLNREDEAREDYISGIGAIQPTIWQDEGGALHALLRTTAGKIYRSDSFDNGKSWRAAYPTDLPNNNSGIDIVNYKGVLYLAMNPVSASWGARTPLVIMRSKDNGASFEYMCTLCDDPIDDVHDGAAQFAYPSIAALNDTLYVSYTHNRKSIALATIKL